MSLKRADFLAGRRIPQESGSVVTAREHPRAVRREGHGANRTPREAADFLAARRIPQLGHRPVPAPAFGNEQLLAVWRKGQGFYASLKSVDDTPAGGVPQKGRVFISGEHP